jgi:hypothetical protein
MNTVIEWLTKLFDTVVTPSVIPATMGGALGGGYKGYHDKLSWKDTFLRIMWGIIFARMFSNMVVSHVSEELQFIVFFVIGYGAIEIVDHVLEIGGDAIKDVIDAKVKAAATKAKIKVEAAKVMAGVAQDAVTIANTKTEVGATTEIVTPTSQGTN